MLTAACEFSASTANVKEAYMARSVNEQPEKTTVFPQDEPFYCIVNLANAPDDTTLSASWYAVDAEGVDNNFLIDEVEFTHGSGEITFDLANDGLWPMGTYKVDLFLNKELKQSLEFEVQ
jgi:hypothetical protein